MGTQCGQTGLSVQVLVMMVFSTENVSVPIQLLNMAGKIVSRLDLRLIEDLASLSNVQVAVSYTKK